MAEQIEVIAMLVDAMIVVAITIIAWFIAMLIIAV